jgi:hypothetical protein
MLAHSSGRSEHLREGVPLPCRVNYLQVRLEHNQKSAWYLNANRRELILNKFKDDGEHNDNADGEHNDDAHHKKRSDQR